MPTDSEGRPLPGTPRPRRSERWTRDSGADGFLQRSSLKVQGLREKDYDRPVIGICTNTSDFNRCHMHFDGMIGAIRDTVLQSGGLPRVFNTMTMGADSTYPIGQSFMHRNLLAMEIEQTALTYAIDALVFLGACDETLPAMLMAAASVDLPSIVLPGGPSFSGYWRGHEVGSGYDCYRAFDALGRGELTDADIESLELSLERSPGHCSTMGTASTMASLCEALGMAPAGSSVIPAVDSRRIMMARQVGEHVVRLLRDDVRPSQIMTLEALENAIRTLAAIDGSSNAVIHLLALAGRLGVDLPLERFDELSVETPVLANVRPSGDYYMNDFFNAGGVAALLKALRPLLHDDALTVTGESLGDAVARAITEDPRVIGTLVEPVAPPRGIAVLRGNIAPDGAIIRLGVASSDLLVHRGRAVVFENKADLEDNLYDPAFDIRADDVIVLRGEGPKGSVGMPDSGRIRVPDKLLREGVTDMVRVTDSRMGGTVSGTAILHVAPESAAGGPLGLVRSGDTISLDVPNRRLSLEVDQDELERRRTEAPPSFAVGPERGFARLYVDAVTQADTGCDFGFLRLASPALVYRGKS
ncbi:MAG TPA: dihydroxy-acid dehydratase [Solirubrobacteraceae bacterium]|nr:dihydroxy-acid dehydratase [Solirubrobacteraceae bacterium]